MTTIPATSIPGAPRRRGRGRPRKNPRLWKAFPADVTREMVRAYLKASGWSDIEVLPWLALIEPKIGTPGEPTFVTALRAAIEAGREQALGVDRAYPRNRYARKGVLQ